MTKPADGPARWSARPEGPQDAPAIREVLVSAVPTAEEAELVEALRADAGAWIDGLSLVTLEGDRIVAQALLTRASVGGESVLALAPPSTPRSRRRGARSSTRLRGVRPAG